MKEVHSAFQLLYSIAVFEEKSRPCFAGTINQNRIHLVKLEQQTESKLTKRKQVEFVLGTNVFVQILIRSIICCKDVPTSPCIWCWLCKISLRCIQSKSTVYASVVNVYSIERHLIHPYFCCVLNRKAFNTTQFSQKKYPV